MDARTQRFAAEHELLASIVSGLVLWLMSVNIHIRGIKALNKCLSLTVLGSEHCTHDAPTKPIQNFTCLLKSADLERVSV